MLSELSSISSIAIKGLVRDRGLLFTDFIIGTFILFFLQYVIWTFIFNSSGISKIGDYDYSQMIFYYAFVISLARLNNGYDVLTHLSSKILDANLDPFLVRPLSYPLLRFYDWLGAGLVFVVPVLLVFIFQAFSIGLTDMPIFSGGINYFLGYLLLFMIGLVLCFFISFFISILCFWFIRPDMVLSILLIMQSFFGGTLLPPSLWPDYIRPLMEVNPFRYIMSIQAETATRIDSELVFNGIKMGSIWLVIFIVLSIVAWKLALVKYESAAG